MISQDIGAGDRVQIRTQYGRGRIVEAKIVAVDEIDGEPVYDYITQGLPNKTFWCYKRQIITMLHSMLSQRLLDAGEHA